MTTLGQGCPERDMLKPMGTLVEHIQEVVVCHVGKQGQIDGLELRGLGRK